MIPVMVDSNVLLDVATDDPTWGDWSAATLARAAEEALLVINALIEGKGALKCTADPKIKES